MTHDCAVCLVRHQPDIHAATLSIRRYFRKQIRAKIQPVKIGARGNKILSPIQAIGRIPTTPIASLKEPTQWC